MKWTLPFLAAAVAAALLLCRVDGGRLPQVVKGGDALSVAFAHAKETISAAMVQKADSYFHGGVDIECHEGHDHEHEHEEHEHHHDDDEPRTTSHESRTTNIDPWRWINLHVRAPERHVHLDGEKAVELLPWFWAAVRADPHNIDAWTTAAYAADRMMKDKALALRVVNEGLEKNPDDPELLLCRGRTYYDRGHGDLAAAYAAFSAAFGAADRIVQRDGDKAPERIVWVRKFAKAYLDEMAKKGVLP